MIFFCCHNLAERFLYQYKCVLNFQRCLEGMFWFRSQVGLLQGFLRHGRGLLRLSRPHVCAGATNSTHRTPAWATTKRQKAGEFNSASWPHKGQKIHGPRKPELQSPLEIEVAWVALSFHAYIPHGKGRKLSKCSDHKHNICRCMTSKRLTLLSQLLKLPRPS